MGIKLEPQESQTAWDGNGMQQGNFARTGGISSTYSKPGPMHKGKPIKYRLLTYGCTLNQSDSNIMRGMLSQAGYTEVGTDGEADVVILNSCTVKEATENKITYRLRQYHNSKKPIVLAGCLSVDEPLVARMAPNAAIVGTSSINRILDAVESAIYHKRRIFKTFSSKENLPRDRVGAIGKVAVAEGCLSSCTFCQTKLARGKLFSYKPEAIENEVAKWAKGGAVEIQLTGQDTGAYGAEIRTNIASLLERIGKADGEFRVRLGMANPEHALKHMGALLKSFESPRIYKFLHIPVQSGSDAVLAKMRRDYSVAQFMQVVDAFKAKFPNMVIATDIIVGFPEETEEDFEKTLELIRRVRFDNVNVSKYSARPFTKAAQLAQVPDSTKKQRAKICSALSRKIALENNRRFVGQNFEIVVTEKQKTMTGRDANYRMFALPEGQSAKIGEKFAVKATGAHIGCVLCAPIGNGAYALAQTKRV